MKISYADGQSSQEVSNLDEATAILTAQYGEAVVIHDEWEPSGGTRERLLVWANESDADNDAGQKAVAEIIREG